MAFGEMEIRLFDSSDIFKNYYNDKKFFKFFIIIKPHEFSIFSIYKDDIGLWKNMIFSFASHPTNDVKVYTYKGDTVVRISSKDIKDFFDFLFLYNATKHRFLSNETYLYFNHLYQIIDYYLYEINKNKNIIRGYDFVIQFNEYYYF